MSRDLSLLHPRLQALFATLVELCAAQGLIIKNTSAYRDAVEQADCVARGTSSLQYPDSMHNWYVAVDFCRNDGAGAYYDSDGFFTRVGRIAESIGLIWGGSFTRPDKPHLQLADWGKTADLLKSQYGSPEAFRLTWDGDAPEATQRPAGSGLCIGAKVIVTGTIYGTGKGGGGSIRKTGSTMYIVDYAGANYPHCYGVAKSPNGTRQGWAAPEILQLADGTVEYQGWPAICNEPATNVRMGPGTSYSILADWPMLGVGNEVDVIGEGMAANGRLWYQIRIAGRHIGWVYGGFLDCR